MPKLHSVRDRRRGQDSDESTDLRDAKMLLEESNFA